MALVAAATACAADVKSKLPSSLTALEKCAVLFETPSGEIKQAFLPSLQVLSLAPDATFSLPPDAPPNVKAVQCGRHSLGPSQHDYKVLAAGYPFNIVADQRVGVLEIVKGQLRFRMLDGEMNESEIEHVQAFLNESQPLFNDAAAAP
ncbi:hypothetical protein ACKVMH_10120 [Lysobacter zhanggongensis]|uniref:Uncharacterized protein n=1 Tax=Lysobacter zhanggongensis TaxID=1774951 RepID=A0ABU7YRP3_9GAMM